MTFVTLPHQPPSGATICPAQTACPVCPPPEMHVLPSASAPPPVADRSADDLVHVSVGRWTNNEGMVVEIDPPKPRPGKAPPYRLVMRGPNLPKSGYGCEFALGDVRQGPGDVLYYRAWCHRGVVSTLGLGLVRSTLSVVVIQDGDVSVHADQLAREAP